MRYLLDTNACIELIRRRSPSLLGRLTRCALGSVGISSITLAELYYGACRSSVPEQNLAALAGFCAPIELLPFDDRAAARVGIIRADLESRGFPIGPLDALIAAQAISDGATLVSDNVREFKRVRGLRVENWLRGA
ncbi:MAG: type II toxin-antitoxin system VapC family toxin [Planctomycetes bacterium]|nr:type II toxin-antitoxin system VapC family toxin [Planctomycetota bacterium]